MFNNESISYTCGICGKTYESIEDRATCEATCITKRNDEAEKQMREQRYVKLKESEKAIYEVLDIANNMIEKHFKEYESLSINKNYPYLKYVFNNSSWWF